MGAELSMHIACLAQDDLNHLLKTRNIYIYIYTYFSLFCVLFVVVCLFSTVRRDIHMNRTYSLYKHTRWSPERNRHASHACADVRGSYESFTIQMCVWLKYHLAHQNNICMVAERAQDPPSTCACVFCPSPRARPTMVSTVATNYVRPGVMDMQEFNITTIVVSSATVFGLSAEDTVLIGKKVFQHWRRHRRQSAVLPIQPNTPTESFTEMDSPGSRLDGALALANAAQGSRLDGDAATLAAPLARQEGQLFLKEMPLQEQKFEEKLAEMKRVYEQQLQKLKLGMDARDQKKNEEMWQLRKEFQEQPAKMLTQNKVLAEVLEDEDKKKETKKEKADEVDALYEYAKISDEEAGQMAVESCLR